MFNINQGEMLVIRFITLVLALGFLFLNATNASAQTTPQVVNYDFDGDGKSDPAIYRPTEGEWWYLRSSDDGNSAVQFGTTGDFPVAADFTGDGITDVTFFRRSTGEWFVLRSEDNSFYSFPFGNSQDIGMVGDFDGDGKADPTVYRGANKNLVHSEIFNRRSRYKTIWSARRFS